jgi:fumarate reductase flavoprotein subunit
VPVAIVGGGACGLVAALAVRDAGVDVLVIERDASPSGSTALSSGFIPACGTRWQAEAGVQDSAQCMGGDILRKARDRTDAQLVRAVVETSGATLEWLADAHGIPFVLVQGFVYPGHSVLRMHAHPQRTGAALMTALHEAAVAAGVDIVTNAEVQVLHASEDGRVLGVSVRRGDAQLEHVGCDALVLACNGYGGNPEMVARYIPEMREALYFGHAGNQGHAVQWAQALGAACADLGAYQGHGSVATPHGALITWAIMMQGGIQVNAHGERFSNEHHGYSEQAVAVLAQPGRTAWNVYDERLHRLALEFEDYRQALEAGAVIGAASRGELAARMGVPADALAATLDGCARCARGEAVDVHGRDFTGAPHLGESLHAVRVTGALFHTQGGVCVDGRARVLREDGEVFPNLFAGGGAARGVSGPEVWGYLSGNGLLSALTLGRIAGDGAARTGAST